MSKESELFRELRLLGGQELLSEEQKAHVWQKFGQTCAVLVGDMSGFTRRTKDYGILHFLTLINRMRGTVLPVLRESGADHIRVEADNIYAAFPHVDDALRGAVLAQQMILEHNRSRPPAEFLELCIGIGYGKVLQAGHEGVFGDQMNLASKLGEDTAKAFEILLTEQAFQKLDATDHPRFEKCSTQVSEVAISYFKALIQSESASA